MSVVAGWDRWSPRCVKILDTGECPQITSKVQVSLLSSLHLFTFKSSRNRTSQKHRVHCRAAMPGAAADPPGVREYSYILTGT